MLVADRYSMLAPLGRGGMGEVWRATDELLGRPVALKLLRATGADADGEAAERFRMEARTAARLNHPRVVAVYDVGAHEDRFYLVMELVDGRSLADELAAGGPMDARRVAGIGAQVADGLAAAHRLGIVHRDIKPSNLLLAADGTVKIADFGVARFAGEVCTALTTTGQVLGTSAYLAPERGMGRPAVPASDVYALGCVLYELLVGHAPFRADNSAALVYQHVEVPPTHPGRLRAGVPGAFADQVMRLLAKNPAERPTAEQIAAWSPEAAVRGVSLAAPAGPAAAKGWTAGTTRTDAWVTATPPTAPAPPTAPPTAATAPAGAVPPMPPVPPAPRRAHRGGPRAFAFGSRRTAVLAGVAGTMLFGAATAAGVALSPDSQSPTDLKGPSATETPERSQSPAPAPSTAETAAAERAGAHKAHPAGPRHDAPDKPAKGKGKGKHRKGSGKNAGKR